MPNWSATNYIAYGDKEQVKRLADTLNNMPNLESGFGKYWMGNFVAGLLGVSRERILSSEFNHLHLRGTFDPDFYASACLCGPTVDESQVFEVKNGELRFSTVSAWSRSEDIEELIEAYFPGVELAWSSTDEFGNFHYTHNPDDLDGLSLVAFSAGYNGYTSSELPALKEHLKEYCDGLEFDEDADWDYFLSDAFVEHYKEWYDAHYDPEDDEDCPPLYEVYTEM